MTDKRFSRRRFLVVIGGAAAGLVCAGCAEQVAVQAEAAPTATPPASVEAAPPSTATAPAVLAAPTMAQPTAAPTAVSVSAPKRSACPKGLINDPYPGRCKLYRDTNGNGYCDLSEV